jgi:hypothetical protein
MASQLGIRAAVVIEVLLRVDSIVKAKIAAEVEGRQSDGAHLGLASGYLTANRPGLTHTVCVS